MDMARRPKRNLQSKRNYDKIIQFLLSALAGSLFAFVWVRYEKVVLVNIPRYKSTVESPQEVTNSGQVYSRWLSSNRNLSTVGADFTEARFLSQKVKVLCLILSTNEKQVKAVKSAWAKRCSKSLFYTSKATKVNATGVIVVNGDSDWQFLCRTLMHVSLSRSQRFDWLIVADDRTFVVLENLRFMVAGLSPETAYYLGNPYAGTFSSKVYNILDAGISINKVAFERLIGLLSKTFACENTHYSSNNDQHMGDLLSKLGINPVDTRDMFGRGRFNPFKPEDLIIPGSWSFLNRIWRGSILMGEQGLSCCSDFAVTFAGLTASDIMSMEYLLYRLKPHYDVHDYNQSRIARSHPTTTRPVKVKDKISTNGGIHDNQRKNAIGLPSTTAKGTTSTWEYIDLPMKSIGKNSGNNL